MKKEILTMTAALLFSIQLSAQKTNAEHIPENTRKAFDTSFPGAQKVQWELDEENYEVSFMLKKAEKSARYDKEGKWLETETPVRASKLPKPVRRTISKEFSGFKLLDVEMIESPDKETMYEMSAEKGQMEYDLTVSAAGVLIRKEEKIRK